jgi:hypothetical protein
MDKSKHLERTQEKWGWAIHRQYKGLGTKGERRVKLRKCIPSNGEAGREPGDGEQDLATHKMVEWQMRAMHTHASTCT